MQSTQASSTLPSLSFETSQKLAHGPLSSSQGKLSFNGDSSSYMSENTKSESSTQFSFDAPM